MDILVIAVIPRVDNAALDSTVQPYFPFRVVTVMFPGRSTLVFLDHLPSLLLGCSVISLQRSVFGR